MVGSILHSRPEVLKAQHNLSALDVFQEGLGYAGALNLLHIDPPSRLPWVNWTRLGIDQGAILPILENARTGFASTQFQSNGVIDRELTMMFPQRVRRAKGFSVPARSAGIRETVWTWKLWSSYTQAP